MGRVRKGSIVSFHMIGRIIHITSIDCKHFDFGNGNCPFGSSCFYKHAYRDGRLEEVVLRHPGSVDGETVIAKYIRLSEFLGNMRIRISNDMEKSCSTSIAEFFSNASVALQLFLRFACWRGREHGVLGMLYNLSRCIFYQSNKIVMDWMGMFESSHQLSIYGTMIFSNGRANSRAVT